MCKVICITNRALCSEPFLTRLEKIAAGRPDALVLREKDLSEQEYEKLAADAAAICRRYGVPLILHSFLRLVQSTGASGVHLPLPVLRDLPNEQLPYFGVSCHSAAEAKEAAKASASYLIAGHIFDTDCKKGLPGRGTAFLREVCGCVKIPVYAIGGITPERVPAVKEAGAAGVCVMSSIMQCEEPAVLIRRLRGKCCYEI